MGATTTLARDARIAGLRHGATFDAVQARRSQLSFLLLLILVGLCLATALAPLGSAAGGPVSPTVLRFGLAGLSATFVAYAVEKERALRRLERALFDEHQQANRLASEAERLHRLVNAGQAVSTTLELDRVADLALAAALRLFDAPGGAVFLNRGDLVMHACQGGNRDIDLADAQARAVAATGEPALVPGRPGAAGDPDARPALAAPLVHGGDVVGVLVVDGPEAPAAPFDHAHLDTLEAFARHAASAIANARLYRAEKTTSEQFAGLHDIQEEFSWLASTA